MMRISNKNHQQYQQNSDPFSQMFGAHSQPVASRPPPSQHYQQQQHHTPQRQKGIILLTLVVINSLLTINKLNMFNLIHLPQQEYHHPPATAVEYHHPPATAVEYHQPPVEYHPVPEHAVEYQPAPEHHAIEILPNLIMNHIKWNIIIHLNTIIITRNLNQKDFSSVSSRALTTKFNTKDPLDKKHHHDEHDLEPYPPPDAFSDHEAPPSYNEHTLELYPPKHHHQVYPEKHYPVEHQVAAYPPPHYAYDLSGGHSHVNPHRSGGYNQGSCKSSWKSSSSSPTNFQDKKTRPIIFTEPPPTPPTTTRRPTTTTARTTTTTTTTTTTARPSRSRARLSARNPGFSSSFHTGTNNSNHFG
ncbi:hypothetical protein CEXT_601641 [Caerostris extrusa]|uniref:Uncharacterized protein n=1 Tax=Caerostris extrusa TaxID=172846 RepID=A0AAV4PII1_CAEEX|nr:hypothetical protein CEXT_601641 [Caerostris extrusa]